MRYRRLGLPVFGHNLFDTMWPWDGITGHKPGDVMARRRPPTAELGIFPHSSVPGYGRRRMRSRVRPMSSTMPA